jgi:site-specific recombinase XerD
VAAALQEWLRAAGIVAGPVFCKVDRHGKVRGQLTGQSVALIVKQRAAAAGLDPAMLSAHSLRSGFLTSAAELGADLLKMMEVSRHRRVDTLQGYVRRADLLVGHAGARFL